MKREELLFIEDILESMNLLEKFSKGLTKEKFIKDKLKQSAIIRQIEIIGEAAKNISNEIKKKYPEIEWRKIIGTRDIFSHAYFEIVLDRVWDIVENNLNDLKQKIIKIKKDLTSKEK